MKKIGLAVLCMCAVLIFTQCSDDETCTAVVEVTMKSTGKGQPGATVVISKGDIEVTGVTDRKGHFSTTFDHEAILDVNASYEGDKTYTAAGSIRLVAGETATAKLALN